MKDLEFIPEPVVDWETLSRAYRPMKEATRGLYRQAIRSIDAAPGVTVRFRRDGRLAGQGHFHSALTALAIRAWTVGDTRGSCQLSKSAGRIEADYADRLREFLRRAALEDLPTADFYPILVADTRDAIRKWGRMESLAFASGVVTRRINDSVEVVGVTPKGDPVSLLLPAEMCNEGFDLFSSVLVFRRLVGSAAVVDILPAVAQPDVHEEAAAQRYRSGPGRRPSAAEMASIRGQLADHPARHITLVG